MKLKTILTVISASCMFNINAYADNIDVRLEGLAYTEQIADVLFDEFSPVSDNGTLMVPLRTVCEQAGMKVIWQPENGAVVIKVECNGEAPINTYAKKLLIKNSSSYLRVLTPDCIYLTMYRDSYEAMLHYNYKDINGETVSYGKIFDLSKTIMTAKDGTLIGPLRNVFNQLGLWVDWDSDTKTVNIFIPDFINAPAGMGALITYEPVETIYYYEVPETVEEQAPPAQILEKYSEPTVMQNVTSDKGVYLGTFKITHYCACEQCCGQYGGNTAWAGALAPGRSIAVDPSVIDKLSTVYIDGYGYRVAEDCGSAIKGNRIDIAVNSHKEALNLGVVYKDVWLVQ